MSDASRVPFAFPRAFVCGWPIAHSRSPLIHNAWLAERGLSGSYEPIAVPPEEADTFFASLREKGFVGGNVTIPHKEAAFRALARRDAAAEAVGAVNTLWFENDRLVGGNTDAYGFATNLDEKLPGWREAETATVLGAGGAARAVVHALLIAGVSRVRVLNRTIERASALAGAFGEKVSAHEPAEWAACLEANDLLVNTQPPHAFAAPIDLSMMGSDALVTDIVYVPLETPLLAAARAHGLRTADGLGMLLHQAVPGFERWFGHRPVVTPALRERVLADITG